MNDMDDIIDEVRRIRDEYAKQFNYDLMAIHQDLVQRQAAEQVAVVAFPSRPVIRSGRANELLNIPNSEVIPRASH